MSKHKLDKQELEALSTYKGASAVIMGYLVRERNVIAPTPFNKLFVELGYEKLHKDAISEVAEGINEDSTLLHLYELAKDGKLNLQDIPNAIGEEEKLKEDDVFSIVTPYIMDKEDQASKLREFRKIQRDGTAMMLLMDKLKKSLVEELKDLGKPTYIGVTERKKKTTVSDKSLLLCTSDWHIGLETFNTPTGSYNFEKLTNMVNSMVNWTLETIEERGIEDVHVVFLGDATESVTMRASQPFDVEFYMTEQISKSIKIFVDMLHALSKHTHVNFSICNANHTRMTKNKEDNIYNDHVEYVILDTLFTLQESLGCLQNVTLTDNREDMIRFCIDVAGHIVVGEHGDKIAKNKERIPSYMRDGKEVSLLLTGHLHSTEIVQESYERLRIQTGSTVGVSNFGNSLNLPNTSPSQMAIILHKNKKTKELIPLMFNENGEIC